MSIANTITEIEFRHIISDLWQVDVEVTTTNVVTLRITNNDNKPQLFPAGQVVLVDSLNWDGGGSITGFNVTDENIIGTTTFFGNDHPRHGYFVAFLLSPKSKDDLPVLYAAGESKSVKAHIEHVSKPKALDLTGTSLAGAAYHPRRKVSTA